MFGAQVYRVVRWLFGFDVVGLLVVLIVPLFLSFLAMPGLCCFLRVKLFWMAVESRRHVYLQCAVQLQQGRTPLDVHRLLAIATLFVER